jgi:hypothetical protein
MHEVHTEKLNRISLKHVQPDRLLIGIFLLNWSAQQGKNSVKNVYLCVSLYLSLAPGPQVAFLIFLFL